MKTLYIFSIVLFFDLTFNYYDLWFWGGEMSLSDMYFQMSGMFIYYLSNALFNK